MPKIVDYPSASFQRCLEMAKAIDSLGGSCSKETCAHKMGLKMTGAFSTLIGAAAKYNLVDVKKGGLSNTALYKSLKLSYSEDEKRNIEIKAFLSPAVFKNLFERFEGKKVPEDILDKFLIKEFSVEERVAQKVGNYFINGIKQLGLVDEIGNLKKYHSENENNPEKEEVVEVEDAIETTTQLVKKDTTTILQESDDYLIHIKGPGIDSQIVIKEQDDLTIVSAMLNKVKNKLSQ